MNRDLYIFSDYFWPAAKAGGPVQSLLHLCAALAESYRIHVVTGAFDLGEKTPLDGVQTNAWNRIAIPGSGKKIEVWYATRGWDLFLPFSIPEESIVYLNGIYSFPYFLRPLFLGRSHRRLKLVICPRGMLQQGALAVRPVKKKVYLAAVRRSGLLKNAAWHATTGEEEADIKKVFGRRAAVMVAPNIPKKPVQAWREVQKSPGTLRLVYLSLITEKKGLLPLLNLWQDLAPGVRLDIYGPVKDQSYWSRCKTVMEKLNGRVEYRGWKHPEAVQETFLQYHASVLLTKGENFGHALYESLSVGRPVITSGFTPWQNLEAKKAGWNLDISDSKKMVDAINRVAAMDNTEFTDFCRGAFELASGYYNQLDPVNQYRQLFSNSGA